MNRWLILLFLFVGAGVFSAQAHDLVDLAANVVWGVYGLLQGRGITVHQHSVETVVTLALILIVISALSSFIGGGRLNRRGR